MTIGNMNPEELGETILAWTDAGFTPEWAVAFVILEVTDMKAAQYLLDLRHLPADLLHALVLDPRSQTELGAIVSKQTDDWYRNGKSIINVQTKDN